MKNTGGLRKGRIAKDVMGKSGGYRVFSFYANERRPVYLLWIIDKTRDDTLTDAQEKVFSRGNATAGFPQQSFAGYPCLAVIVAVMPVRLLQTATICRLVESCVSDEFTAMKCRHAL